MRTREQRIVIYSRRACATVLTNLIALMTLPSDANPTTSRSINDPSPPRMSRHITRSKLSLNQINLVGDWRAEGLTLSLLVGGEATLTQVGMSSLTPHPLKDQVALTGFWWVSERHLCLSFDLSSSCVQLISTSSSSPQSPQSPQRPQSSQSSQSPPSPPSLLRAPELTHLQLRIGRALIKLRRD